MSSLQMSCCCIMMLNSELKSINSILTYEIFLGGCRADCILCGSFCSVCKLEGVLQGRMDLMCDKVGCSNQFMIMGVSIRMVVVVAGLGMFLWHRYNGGGFP